MAGHARKRTPKQIAARKQKPSTIKRLARRAAEREAKKAAAEVSP